jgi:beta-glucosidase
MPGPTRDRGAKLVEAVKAGKVSPETIRERARAVLLLLQRVGAFEDATMHEEQAVDRPEHRALIRKMGAEGTVLLKNDGTLPLARTGLGKIVALGPNAAEARAMGGGSAMINAHYRVSPLEGLKAALKGSNAIVHARAAANNRLVSRIEIPVAIEVFDTPDFSGPVVGTQTQPFSEVFWGDPPAGVTSRGYSARMRVSFRAEEDGEYLFGVTSAGLAKLSVNGDLVVNSWDGWTVGPSNFFAKGNEEVRATRTLEAGKTYEILVEFRAHSGEDMDFNAVRFGVEKPLGDRDIASAVAEARDADVVVIYAGRNGEWDTEGNDLPGFALPGRQDEMIAAVAAVNPKTVVVLQTGGPVLMPWLDKVAAVLQAWYPGQEAGNAIADVLFGEAEPAGRLPQTFPKRAADNSAFTGDVLTYPGKDGHVAYQDGVFIGYRHHDRAGIGTLFPFGFGLSYTTFQWGQPSLSLKQMDEGGIHVSVPVTNTGSRAGSEVVQVYVRSPKAPVDRPDKELRGFMKLELAAGGTGRAVIKLSPRDLAYYDVERAGWVAVAGTYEAIAASHAEDIRGVASFTLAEDWFEPVRD